MRRIGNRTSRGFLLSGLLCLAPPALAGSVIITPPSATPLVVDGLFGGGVDATGRPLSEWSDVTPASFRSPGDLGGTLLSSPLAFADSLAYWAICPEPGRPAPHLHFTSAYASRTAPFFLPGETIAEVSFPVFSPALPDEHGLATVEIFSVPFRGAERQIQVDVDGDGDFDVTEETAYEVRAEVEGSPFDIPGLEVAVGFGLSPLSTTVPHLIVELSAALHVTDEFVAASAAVRGPFDTPFDGAICPEPFRPPTPGCPPLPWTAELAKDAFDPPASRAVITINPDGSVVVDASGVPDLDDSGGVAVPGPATLALLALGLAALGFLARKKPH